MSDTDFEAVFGSEPNIAFNSQTVQQIPHFRSLLENNLFFDRLLKAVGVDKSSKLYPPRSNNDLKKLYAQIVKSVAPEHHKQSLVYYILKDVPKAAHKAKDYAETYHIPEKYRTFMDGVWHLDKLQLEEALIYLTDPSLIPTFPEEILHILCKYSPDNDPSLPLLYYHSVSPAIKSIEVLEELYSVMLRASLPEAFFSSRGQGEATHQHLFKSMVTTILSGPLSETRAAQCVVLVGLPLNDDEEKLLEDFLLVGKGKNLPGAKDTVIMRRIATGRLQEAIDDSRNITGRRFDGVNWASLREGLQQGFKSQLTPKG